MTSFVRLRNFKIDTLLEFMNFLYSAVSLTLYGRPPETIAAQI